MVNEVKDSGVNDAQNGNEEVGVEAQIKESQANEVSGYVSSIKSYVEKITSRFTQDGQVLQVLSGDTKIGLMKVLREATTDIGKKIGEITDEGVITELKGYNDTLLGIIGQVESSLTDEDKAKLKERRSSGTGANNGYIAGRNLSSKRGRNRMF